MKTKQIALVLSFFKTVVAWSSLTLILAAITLLSGCWGGVSPILEDYNSRFAWSEIDTTESSNWTVVEAKGNTYPNARMSTAVPTRLEEEHPGIFPLPEDMRWFIKTPKGVIPEEIYDVTRYYDEDYFGKDGWGCLYLPPAKDLGLKHITLTVAGTETAGNHYQVIGEGTREDGTGLRILSTLVTTR